MSRAQVVDRKALAEMLAAVSAAAARESVTLLAPTSLAVRPPFPVSVSALRFVFAVSFSFSRFLLCFLYLQCPFPFPVSVLLFVLAASFSFSCFCFAFVLAVFLQSDIGSFTWFLHNDHSILCMC